MPLLDRVKYEKKRYDSERCQTSIAPRVNRKWIEYA